MRKHGDDQEQLPFKQLDSGGFTQKRVNHEENSCFEWGLSGSRLLESLLLLGRDGNTARRGVSTWVDTVDTAGPCHLHTGYMAVKGLRPV